MRDGGGADGVQFVCHHNTMYIYKSIDTPTLDRYVILPLLLRPQYCYMGDHARIQSMC
jgi:hypothetical protein